MLAARTTCGGSSGPLPSGDANVHVIDNSPTSANPISQHLRSGRSRTNARSASVLLGHGVAHAPQERHFRGQDLDAALQLRHVQ